MDPQRENPKLREGSQDVHSIVRVPFPARFDHVLKILMNRKTLQFDWGLFLLHSRRDSIRDETFVGPYPS